jgi:opacity protein-like surface antigen
MNVRALLGFAVIFTAPAVAGQSVQQKPEPAWNSRPKVEVVGSVGLGHVFRFEDRGFGYHFSAGAGVEVTVWRGLRAGGEVNRTVGFDPDPAQCGGISPGPGQPPFPCTGSARVGVSAFTAASFTAAWYFGSNRVQPYVVGGLSVLRTKEYNATYQVHSDHVEIQENSSTATGTGLTLGAGLRACVTRRLSIRPEFRLSDGTALSPANLSQIRLSVGIGYGW